jgi:hypothetical protein
MKNWEMKNATMGSPEAEKLLKEGWEPFSVAIISANNQLNPTQIMQIPQVFFRKQTEKTELRSV